VSNNNATYIFWRDLKIDKAVLL